MIVELPVLMVENAVKLKAECLEPKQKNNLDVYQKMQKKKKLKGKQNNNDMLPEAAVPSQA